MSPITREQAGQIFSALQDKTMRGEIKWERLHRDKAAFFLPGGSRVNNVFRTEYADAHWLLAEYELRRYNGDDDSYFYEPETLLSVLAEDEKPLYAFPHAAGLDGLVEAAKVQAANVPAILDRVLGKHAS